MTLFWPIALFGFALLVPLAAVYLFHRRPALRDVSSLLLWDHLTRLSPAGRRVERWRHPLTFVLETIIIVLLILAAAEPLLRVRQEPPVILVLDNSFSMLATDHEGTTARKRAIRHIGWLVGRSSQVLPILAGQAPRLLPATDRAGLNTTLDAWRCMDREADLPAAVALAREIAGPNARLIVLTDAPPEEKIFGVRWVAVGEQTDNAAIVAAVRNKNEIVLDIANYSTMPLARTLSLSGGNIDATATRPSPVVPPGKTARVRFPVDSSAGTVRVALDHTDSLSLDDTVFLASPAPRRVPVRIDVPDHGLQEALTMVLTSLPNAVITNDDAGDPLIFSQTPVTGRVVFHTGDGSASPIGFSGSFLIDESHPLGEGLDLAGAVWAAPASVTETPLPGRVIVLGRSTVLVSIDDGGVVHIALRLDASNLARHPAWPVLIWNTVQLAAANLPGPERDNAGMGDIVRVNIAGDAPAEHRAPNGSIRILEPADGRIEVVVASPGIHTVSSGERIHTIGVSALDAAESDLRSRATLEENKGTTAQANVIGTRSVAWVMALGALGVLLWHARLTMRRRGDAG